MTEKTVELDSAPLDADARAQAQEKADAGVEHELVLEDLLVEDVSIDGMCGVY